LLTIQSGPSNRGLVTLPLVVTAQCSMQGRHHPWSSESCLSWPGDRGHLVGGIGLGEWEGSSFILVVPGEETVLRGFGSTPVGLDGSVGF